MINTISGSVIRKATVDLRFNAARKPVRFRAVPMLGALFG
jgi:hypothetical protein